MNCFITVIQLKCSTNQLNRICSVTKKISWWFHNSMSVHTKWLSARGNTVNLIGIARRILHDSTCVEKSTCWKMCMLCKNANIPNKIYKILNYNLQYKSSGNIHLQKSAERLFWSWNCGMPPIHPSYYANHTITLVSWHHYITSHYITSLPWQYFMTWVGDLGTPAPALKYT